MSFLSDGSCQGAAHGFREANLWLPLWGMENPEGTGWRYSSTVHFWFQKNNLLFLVTQRLSLVFVGTGIICKVIIVFSEGI